MLSEPFILSLGSINADFQFRVEEPLEEGRTQIASDFIRLSGGKAANVAVQARRLGHRVELVGRVGDDDLAEQALAPLRDEGVGLQNVSVVQGTSTAVSIITVPPGGKKSILLALNANDAWDEAHIREAAAVIARASEGSILAINHEVPAEVVAAAIGAARTRGLLVVLDPSPPERVKKDLLSGVHALTANAKEAEILTGVAVKDFQSAAGAARKCIDLGVTVACVKLHDGGCLLAHEHGLVAVPAPSCDVVDSTGAGDAFAGALAVALLERRTPRDAVCFAVAASSLAVTGYGSQPAYPTRERTDALMSQIIENSYDLQPSA